MDGELNVLDQRVEGPGAHLLRHGAAEEEAGAAHGAAGAQQMAGVVEVAALPQIPQAGAGAEPVVAVVLGIAVAGDDVLAVGEGAVHLLDIVGREDIVGVKDEVAVKALGVVPAEVVHQGGPGVALAHLGFVGPLVHGGAGHPGNERRVVGAVVRQDEDVDVVGVVGLAAETGDEIADDGLLVPGADHDGEVVDLRLAVGVRSAEPDHGNIQKLVGVAEEKDDADDPVDGFQRFHRERSFPRGNGAHGAAGTRKACTGTAARYESG